MITLKISLVSILVSLAIWELKIRAKTRKVMRKLRNYRRAEAFGRLRLKEGI